MARFPWTFCLLIAGAFLALGCHRGYYRRQADAEVQALIRQKANDPRWDLSDTTIDVRSESRMYDPFSPDHPPLPPDDAASAKLMQVVDNKKGYPHWHANGDTDYVENPDWMSFLPVDERGVLVIDSQRAVALALTHSTVYQRQREELYLSALDVSLERFGAQPFGFDLHSDAGRSATLDVSKDNSELGHSSSLEWRRLTATGAQWAVSIANSIVWQFSGADTQAATNVISFSLLQPLLRGGGRDVVLEQLTQVERTLLANVRQFERFRQGFFLQVTTGRNPGNGVIGSLLNAPTLGSGSAGSLLGLLRSQQSIRIQEFNVASLRNVLSQFQEFRRAERIDSLQLNQVESTLYDSQRRLLSAKNDYQTQLDNFKRTLGLPPDLPIEVQDTFLGQFKLIDDQNNLRQQQIASLKTVVGESLLGASAFIEAERTVIPQAAPEAPPAAAGDPEQELEALRRQQELELTEEYGIAWTDELQRRISSVLPMLDQVGPLIDNVAGGDVARVREDIERLRQVRPRRAEALAKLRKLVDSGAMTQNDLEPAVLADTSLELPEGLLGELANLERKFAENSAAVEQLRQSVQEILEQGPKLDAKELYRQIDERLLSVIPKLLTDLANTSLELILIQARARTDSIELPIVELDAATAIQIARCCRLDWMNARSGLVDSWRRIEVFADDLEAGLELGLDGSVGGLPLSDGDNHPFQLLSETAQFSGRLNFDSPLTRLAERNRYREQLIQYQRDRRAYYEFEDEVKRGLRRTIREIELNKILFELGRRTVKVAVQQVELARLRLEAPPQAAAGGAGRSQLGATTARDLTGAINSLQTAQDSFLNVWVAFEVLRRDLDFDMGTIQLTDDGFWVDPGVIDPSIGVACGAVLTNMPPEIPAERSAVPVEIRIEPLPNQDPPPPVRPVPVSAIRPTPIGVASGELQPAPQPPAALPEQEGNAESPAARSATPDFFSNGSSLSVILNPAESRPTQARLISTPATPTDRAAAANQARFGLAAPEVVSTPSLTNSVGTPIERMTWQSEPEKLR